VASHDKTLKVPILYREFELNRSSLNREKRTVRVQFSSEAAVKRWFGTEILDHDKNSVDLSRIRSGAAVLCEHDTMLRCGITEGGEITEKRTGEAEVRFAKTPLGDSTMGEVEDGTLRWLSTGYKVDKFEVDEDEEEYRAVRWTPLEISFVGIPADPSCKVLRSNQIETEAEIMFKRSIQHHIQPGEPGGGGNLPAAPAILTKEDFSRICNERDEMMATALQFQRTHPAVAEFTQKALKDKTGLVDYQRKVMELISTPGRDDISAPAIGDGQPAQYRGEKSFGRRFVESKSYKDNIAVRRFKGIEVNLPDEFQFRADPNILTRATLNAVTEGLASGTGTAGVNIDQKKDFNLLGVQPLYVADLFAQGTTTGDQVRYIRESTFTNAATRVAEGAAKPEATLDLGIVNATVEKTAVFLNVTEEMLADFGQAASFVNGRLAYMVQALEDQQLLTGSGTAQITGILSTSGIQTISGLTNTIDAYLRAKSNVEGAAGSGFAMPDAYVLHPVNWFSARASKDSNGQYLFGGPGYAPYGVGGFTNVGMMWGLPVVATTSITQGTALVGAFRMGAQIFRRQGLTIKTTDSHASLFVSNILTVLAEQRMALAVYQPNKFSTITAIPAPV
jgi:phage head maturation protease